MVYNFQGKLLFAYVVTCLILLLIGIYRRQQDKMFFAFVCSILCVYLYLVIKITQFPIYTGEIFAEDLRGNFWNSINLIPLKDSLHLTSIYNIILTLPFGFLIPMVRSKKTSFAQIALAGVATGFALEFMQFLQLLANDFTFRVIDVNDILCNFTGVLIGFACFKILRKIIMAIYFSKSPETGPNPIESYFEHR